MALEEKICVMSGGCDGFYMFEKTGVYDVSLNPTGWDAPNPPVSDASAAVISVLYAGATVPVEIDVYNTLPTDNVNAAYYVSATALGLTEMPAGLTRVTYTVTVDDVLYSATALVLFDCEVSCCVSQLLIPAAAAVTGGDCCNECKDEKVLNALFAEAVLEGARAATCSGLVDVVNTDIEYLQTLCAATPCSDC